MNTGCFIDLDGQWISLQGYKGWKSIVLCRNQLKREKCFLTACKAAPKSVHSKVVQNGTRVEIHNVEDRAFDKRRGPYSIWNRIRHTSRPEVPSLR